MTDELKIKSESRPSTLKFELDGEKEPVLELRQNGDFLVSGKKVANDLEVYEAFRRFMEGSKCIQCGNGMVKEKNGRD